MARYRADVIPEVRNPMRSSSAACSVASVDVARMLSDVSVIDVKRDILVSPIVESVIVPRAIATMRQASV